MTGGECFERGFNHISKYLPNFPREFVGHGLGLNPHEQPRMNRVNKTVLEPDMLFMIHPNQYLPETGYLLCGEPVVMTARGAEPLTAQKAALASVD